MRLITILILAFSASSLFAQDMVIVGDSVKITWTSVETMPIEDTYDQDLRDIELINQEIAEYTKRIENAQARLADRQARIAKTEKRAKELKAEREANAETPSEPIIEEKTTSKAAAAPPPAPAPKKKTTKKPKKQ